MADIAALKQAFRDGLDIHAMTASEMFGVPIEGMPAAIRRQAKAINFGVIYGISAFGLAEQPAHPARGREAVHRHLFRAVPRHPRVHGPHHRLRQGARPRRDAVRPAHPHAGDQRPRAARRRRAAAGDQRADPGLGGGHHPAGDDPGAGRRSTGCRRGCCCRCTTSCCSRSTKGAVEETVAAVRGVMEGAALPAVALDGAAGGGRRHRRELGGGALGGAAVGIDGAGPSAPAGSGGPTICPSTNRGRACPRRGRSARRSGDGQAHATRQPVRRVPICANGPRPHQPSRPPPAGSGRRTGRGATGASPFRSGTSNRRLSGATSAAPSRLP